MFPWLRMGKNSEFHYRPVMRRTPVTIKTAPRTTRPVMDSNRLIKRKLSRMENKGTVLRRGTTTETPPVLSAAKVKNCAATDTRAAMVKERKLARSGRQDLILPVISK